MIGKIKQVGNEILFNCINHNNIHDAIALLDDNEVDVNAKNINGMTPLHFAVQVQNKTMIETLLQYGADPNIQENEDIGFNTPLHRAAENNMLDVMDLFLQCGGDPSIQNKNGFTCLHIAARNGYLDMCKLLVTKGKFSFSCAKCCASKNIA